MGVAYYMKFIEGHKGSKNKVGGQPIYIPEYKPWSKEDDKYYGFLLELNVDGKILNIPDTQSIQIYQSIEYGDDPQPVIIQVSYYAKINLAGNILVHQDANAWDIEFEKRVDPDILDEIKMEDHNLFKSKLKGIDPWSDFERDYKFLGQISEAPINLNFGGMLCSIYIDSTNHVIAKLH
jgi:hypothetical protein